MAIHPTAATGTYKRAGGDKRGSAASRRARKNWMLGLIRDPRLGWAPFGGNGSTVDCVHCHQPQTFQTVEADRIVPGGPYARHNVQPACRACNLSRSDNTDWAYAA